MNILFLDRGAYTKRDVLQIFSENHISYKHILYAFRSDVEDDFFAYRFVKILEADSFDAVFSINYISIAAQVCYEKNIKYISWSYDSPLNPDMVGSTIGYPTNYCFLFDRTDYEKFRNMGVDTVYHLPLAANTRRLLSVPLTPEQRAVFTTDISFVGQIYQSPLPTLLAPLSDFDKGYLTAMVATQKNIYGTYFVEEMIHPELLERMNQCYEKYNCHNIKMTAWKLSYSVATHIAREERISLLNRIGEEHPLMLYSRNFDDNVNTQVVSWQGTAGYYTEMPLVFRLSRINLNSTLRCIQTGIPLRALDILGSGGFLLSNYQPELAEYFENETEVVLYDSIEDAACKADFYLKHEDLRHRIALNGLARIQQDFTYEARFQEMFSAAGL